MHRVHIRHPKTPRADALEAQKSSWVKYASACVFGSFGSSQKGKCFPFWFVRFVASAGQIRKHLCIWLRQIGKCLPIWIHRIVGSSANSQVLANLDPSDRWLCCANTQVLAYLNPLRLEWPGGPGRLPALGSHRSGLAPLAHPARQITGSQQHHSRYPLALRLVGNGARCLLRLAPQWFRYRPSAGRDRKIEGGAQTTAASHHTGRATSERSFQTPA